MEQSTESRILEYIRRQQPVKLVVMLSDLGIDRETYYAATLLLRQSRKIISAGRHGIFAGDEAYMAWWEQLHDRLVKNKVP
ncbi:TPA: hypothetical protein I8Y21_001110 [Klebsiella oxytoca]|uniref:Uncharacterized protein n=1 Tax=Klebsiella oxytoca TaxID=571 RepID=A0AAN5L5Y7_KLEOX|nr:hypothetical protein [Klebsiella oxytoca]